MVGVRPGPPWRGPRGWAERGGGAWPRRRTGGRRAAAASLRCRRWRPGGRRAGSRARSGRRRAPPPWSVPASRWTASARRESRRAATGSAHGALPLPAAVRRSRSGPGREIPWPARGVAGPACAGRCRAAGSRRRSPRPEWWRRGRRSGRGGPHSPGRREIRCPVARRRSPGRSAAPGGGGSWRGRRTAPPEGWRRRAGREPPRAVGSGVPKCRVPAIRRRPARRWTAAPGCVGSRPVSQRLSRRVGSVALAWSVWCRNRLRSGVGCRVVPVAGSSRGGRMPGRRVESAVPACAG